MRGKDRDMMLIKSFAQSRDAHAFAELVGRYENLVYSTAFRILGRQDEAEVAAQECFLDLAKQAHAVESSIGGWLHKSAIRVALGMKGALELGEEGPSRHVECLESKERVLSWIEIESRIDQALNELSEEDRYLLVEHYLQRKPEIVLARERGIAPPALSQRMGVALNRLRGQMELSGGVIPPEILADGLLKNSMICAPATLIEKVSRCAMLQMKPPMPPLGADGSGGGPIGGLQKAGVMAVRPMMAVAGLMVLLAGGALFSLYLISTWSGSSDERSTARAQSGALVPKGAPPIFTGSLPVGVGSAQAIVPSSSSADMLIQAINSGNTAQMWQLIQSDPGLVNGLLNNGMTPLMMIAASGQSQSFAYFAYQVLDLNIRDKAHGATALQWAAYKGQAGMVTVLLQHGASEYHLDKYGNTAMSYAVNAALGKGTPTPSATKAQYDAVVTALRAQGTQPQLVVTLRKFFPLIESGDVKAVQELVKADPALANAANQTGFTAVMVALRTGNSSMITTLAESAALSLFESAALGRADLLGIFLSEAGTLNSKQGCDGRTALHWACAMGQKNTMTLLVDRGCEVNLLDEDGKTPLDLAEEGKHESTAQAIRDAGGKRAADLDATPVRAGRAEESKEVHGAPVGSE